LLTTTISSYSDSNNGYGDKFKAYSGYVNDMIPTQLNAFMDWDSDAPGNKYFTCVYQADGQDALPESVCPTPGVGWADNESFKITYTLQDHDGFFAELLSTYGIPEEWVIFDDDFTFPDCSDDPNDPCPDWVIEQVNFPVRSDNVTVPDPSDVFTKGLVGLEALQVTLASSYVQMMLGWWNGSNNDVGEVAVMPVSMAYAAAQGMEQVVLIGGEVLDADRKNLILEILGIVFLVIPFIGEAAGEISATALSFGRIINLIDAAGNTGLDVFSLVSDPNSAPVAIMGLCTSFHAPFVIPSACCLFREGHIRGYAPLLANANLVQ
jgi:chitinase